MKWLGTKNLGMLLLAIWMIATGVLAFVHISFAQDRAYSSRTRHRCRCVASVGSLTLAKSKWSFLIRRQRSISSRSDGSRLTRLVVTMCLKPARRGPSGLSELIVCVKNGGGDQPVRMASLLDRTPNDRLMLLPVQDSRYPEAGRSSS